MFFGLRGEAVKNSSIWYLANIFLVLNKVMRSIKIRLQNIAEENRILNHRRKKTHFLLEYFTYKSHTKIVESLIFVEILKEKIKIPARLTM